MRVAGWFVALVGLWLLAWGEVSLANVASGLVVALLLLVFFPLAPRGDLSFHPIGAVRLAGYVTWQLVVSNIAMTRQILRPRPALHPGVLAHHLRRPSEGVVTVMTSVISLSPGTLTVDTTPDASTVYVHFLSLDDVDAARRSLLHLEDLVVHALGAPGPDPEHPEPGARGTTPPTAEDQP